MLWMLGLTVKAPDLMDRFYLSISFTFGVKDRYFGKQSRVHWELRKRRNKLMLPHSYCAFEHASLLPLASIPHPNMKKLENSISKVPSSAKRFYNFKREKDTL